MPRSPDPTRDHSGAVQVQDGPVSSTPRASIAATTRASARRRIGVVMGVMLLTLFWVYAWQAGKLDTVQRIHAAQVAGLGQMQVDAEHIRALRTAPQRATDRERANDELLAQVDAALARADVPKTHWQDSIPQPAQRVTGEPYERHTTRLYLEGVTLVQAVGISWALLEMDPTLELSGMRLTAPGANKATSDHATWNAELAVSYLLFRSPTSPNHHSQ